ncbi:hypothetical protein [Cyclobacterium jeungdonense]|uniref:Uncharacterized protein n=1 Tax=Cyclobacterium jeungdonense TaxID=708087 RepID=A0ABT8C3V4_9BACT|nr:hypothetical protein [Cyclobacterium jeungdonense]MDN3687439.1 hypothetical protein [Cyclobacterium jeungdonense]
MNLSFAFQLLSSAKVNTESSSRPVGPSQPLALVLNCLEYSLTFAYQVKSKLLIGPIFGGAYNAVYNEEAFGQYIFVLKFLIEHSKSSNYPEFLGLFEASISYTEKIFLFHYCPLMLKKETVNYLKNCNFLQKFPEKHYRKFFSKNYW